MFLDTVEQRYIDHINKNIVYGILVRVLFLSIWLFLWDIYVYPIYMY